MELQNSPEYSLLPIPFTVLTICGAWYSEKWTTLKKRAYKLFATVLLLLDIVLLIETLTNLALTSGTDKFNFENIFASLVFIVGLFKKINVLYYRYEILNLILNVTNNHWYQTRNSKEDVICKSIQSETRRATLLYALCFGVAIIIRNIIPISEAGTLMILPLEVWYPYNVNTLLTFVLTYLHQIISGVMLTFMHFSTDTLLIGLLKELNSQILLLKSRLRDFGSCKYNKYSYSEDVSSETTMDITIAQRIREHESIFRFGANLQETFKPILIVQMCVTVPNIILNTYILSVYPNRASLKYLMTCVFALVPMMVMFMFCWYGNDVVLSSTDVGFALYDSNWTGLNKSTKKSILTTIIRTSKSIVISAGAVIPLNTDSFIKIIKTCYSVFNLLQRTYK